MAQTTKLGSERGRTAMARLQQPNTMLSGMLLLQHQKQQTDADDGRRQPTRRRRRGKRGIS
jgi:hypothetical protein